MTLQFKESSVRDVPLAVEEGLEQRLKKQGRSEAEEKSKVDGYELARAGSEWE